MSTTPAHPNTRINLTDLSCEQLTGALASFGLEPFRAKQLLQWIYVKGVRDFDAMSNIAKPTRLLLAEQCSLERPAVDEDQISEDGTRKWLFRFTDGNQAETVFIPEEDRGTLCISSQVGCTLSCTFCHTGTQKLVRNLTAGEIVGQVLAARDALEDWSGKPDQRRITNIVLMGMGEPLFNFDHVTQAMQLLMDADGMAWSRKKITLSTSGHVPRIRECAETLGVNLAISLHAVNDTLRNELVPLNKRWNIIELLEACCDYAKINTNQRITFEYVMLAGVNDSDAEARKLVQLLRGIPAKVNLIPFNPWPGSAYVCSDAKRIRAFASIVQKAGYASPIRTPRGQDILAACGQLKSASEKRRKPAIQI